MQKTIKLKEMNKYLTVIFVFGLCLACSSEKKSVAADPALGLASEEIPASFSKEVSTKVAFKFPYNLSNPIAEFKLSDKLTEISGLGFTQEEDALLSINDEQGKIFYLNIQNGEIDKSIKFAKSGDYEGIEQIGETIYVVNSSGSIYEVTNLDAEKPDTEKYNTPLNADNDVEGLGYSPKLNSLLVACKGKPGDKKKYANQKAIYAFSLDSKKLSEEPLYLIAEKDIDERTARGNRLIEALNGIFAPSGIATHPKTKDMYVLSAVGKAIAVLNSKGKLIHVEQMNKSQFKQPEGICFASDGTLFISSEGKSGKGRLFRFEMQ